MRPGYRRFPAFLLTSSFGWIRSSIGFRVLRLAPIKRKGRALRVRWKKRCLFPAASMRASGMKAVAAKSGGRMERSRSMSRKSLACLRCMSLAASRVVSMADLSPCVHGAGASQQEHCGVVPVGKQFGK